MVKQRGYHIRANHSEMCIRDRCDHEVGTGKTLIMCMAAHEMKRLGMAHKPMINGLKANVAEIAATYQTCLLYTSQKKRMYHLNKPTKKRTTWNRNQNRPQQNSRHRPLRV